MRGVSDIALTLTITQRREIIIIIIIIAREEALGQSSKGKYRFCIGAEVVSSDVV